MSFQMTGYGINYLILHNKLLQTLAALSNNEYLLSHTVSMQQEFRSSLAGWFYLQLGLGNL